VLKILCPEYSHVTYRSKFVTLLVILNYGQLEFAVCFITAKCSRI